MPSEHRGVLISADDVQNAVNARNLAGAAQTEINWVRNAVSLGIEKPVHRTLAIAPLECLSPNMIIDEGSKIDRAAIANRAKSPDFLIRGYSVLYGVLLTIPLLGVRMIAKSNL